MGKRLWTNGRCSSWQGTSSKTRVCLLPDSVLNSLGEPVKRINRVYGLPSFVAWQGLKSWRPYHSNNIGWDAVYLVEGREHDIPTHKHENDEIGLPANRRLHLYQSLGKLQKKPDKNEIVDNATLTPSEEPQPTAEPSSDTSPIQQSNPVPISNLLSVQATSPPDSNITTLPSYGHEETTLSLSENSSVMPVTHVSFFR